MNRAIWALALVAVVLWSLFSWGSYALVTGGSDWLGANAGLLGLQADAQHWLQWSLRLVEQFGVVLLWIVWSVGAATTLIGAWVATRLVGAVRRHASAAPQV
jgi:hypothetical protein